MDKKKTEATKHSTHDVDHKIQLSYFQQTYFYFILLLTFYVYDGKQKLRNGLMRLVPHLTTLWCFFYQIPLHIYNILGFLKGIPRTIWCTNENDYITNLILAVRDHSYMECHRNMAIVNPRYLKNTDIEYIRTTR